MKLFRRPKWKLAAVTNTLRFDQETGGMLAYAPPGGGKGTTLVIPSILSNNRDSFVILDPAGQNLAVCGAYLRASGVKVEAFNPAGVLPGVLTGRASINGLASIDMKNDPFAEVHVRDQAGAIVEVPENAGENAHFFISAQVAFGSLALHLLATLGGDKVSWPVVAEIAALPLHKLNEIFGDMCRSRIPSVAQTGAAYYCPIKDGKPLRKLTDAQRNCIENMVQASAFLCIGGIKDMFATAGTSFAKGKKERTAFFLVLPETSSIVMRKAAHLLLMTARRELATTGGLHTVLILDELAAATPPSCSQLVMDVMALARKNRCRVLGIFQSWPQYVSWCGSEERAQALRATAGGVVFMGAADNATIAEVQRTAGRYTIWTPSTNPLHISGVEGSSSPKGVELLSPEFLRDQLRNGTQTVFLNGSRRTVIVSRTSYLAVPELRARAAPDPYHLDH